MDLQAAAIACRVGTERGAVYGGSVADGPGTSGCVGGSCRRVVRALPECSADGMNWRHVHDVEAHRRDFRQLFFDIVQCSMLAGNR